MKFLQESGLLTLSFIFVFIWQLTPLADFTIPALGLLILLYFITSARRKDGGFLMQGDGIWSIFILNTIILLLIFSTGGFTSNLFFLLYFLGFGIAFVFQPATVFVFMIGTILVFLPDALKDDVYGNMLWLGSFVLISPIAYYFGREYRKRQEQDEEISKSTSQIKKDVENIKQRHKNTLSETDKEDLNNIEAESERLKNL